jgi:hypothetical protein
MKPTRQIPLDTLGNPMPPPVRPEHNCKIHRKEWRRWWTRYYNDELEQELDCNVCGLHFPENALIRLERVGTDPEVQRKVLNTAADQVRICRGCKAECGMCGRVTLPAQKKKHSDLCQVCIDVQKSTTKKRKTSPSGS